MEASFITIDNREKRPDPMTRQAELISLGISAEVAPLACGDYFWTIHDSGSLSHWWIVERKTIEDFCSSADDGRLNHFAECTAEEGGTGVLLLEGDQSVPPRYGRPWTPEQIDNLLLSLQRVGIVVVRSPNPHRTSHRLASLWKYSKKAEHEALFAVARPPTKQPYWNPRERALVRFFMGYPGIGEGKARAIVNHFGDRPENAVRAILDQDMEAFSDVAGIGKGLIKKAKEFLWQTSQ